MSVVIMACLGAVVLVQLVMFSVHLITMERSIADLVRLAETRVRRMYKEA
jgi:hypothetical protein